jgi:hypothetical protein
MVSEVDEFRGRLVRDIEQESLNVRSTTRKSRRGMEWASIEESNVPQVTARCELLRAAAKEADEITRYLPDPIEGLQQLERKLRADLANLVQSEVNNHETQNQT